MITQHFFFSLQYISQSGWSAMFRRIPEALMAFIPYASIIMLLLFFGLHDIYQWSNPDVVAHDELLQHKAPYLNIPFFMIRIVIFCGSWVLLTRYLRKLSLQEDNLTGMAMFEKMELKISGLLFIMALHWLLLL